MARLVALPDALGAQPHSMAAYLRNTEKSAAKTRKSDIVSDPMAILKKNAFSRRVPDLVTEELVAVLSRRASFEFKQLFDVVHENLRARNAASGGEEMLRLRAYEKLQNLVARGAVKKDGKKYKGLPAALKLAIQPQNGHIPPPKTLSPAAVAAAAATATGTAKPAAPAAAK